MHTVLVLGGYGNFGASISRALVNEPDVRLLIAGRNLKKAQRFALQLGLSARRGLYLDTAAATLAQDLQGLGVMTLIHAAGPFQGQDYHVARACIEAGCNYIDLADGRDFVANIAQLNIAARVAEVLVTSGASSLPALSSAVVDHFLPEFSRLESINHTIVSGAGTPGLATLRSVLGYCGKPFTRLQEGVVKTVYGWQDLHSRIYPQTIGRRWLGNCDVPDLILFPRRYKDVKTVSFHAGLNNPASHLAIWALSWLVRWGWMKNLALLAKPLRWLSLRLEALGRQDSAMHMTLTGLDLKGLPLTRTWHMLAFNQHGPLIPCGAAIALTRKLVHGEPLPHGAAPCIGLLTLEEYLSALAGLKIVQVLN